MSEFKKCIIALIVLLAIVLVSLCGKLIRCGKSKRSTSVAQKPSTRIRKIRLAMIMQNTILLGTRKAGKSAVCTDIPFEVTLCDDESVENGLMRMLQPVFGDKLPDARFCLKYAYNEQGCTSDNFLFIIYCQGNGLPERLKGVFKPWTRRQIESNIGKSVFCSQFEEEYKHLRLVVDTWEMFK